MKIQKKERSKIQPNNGKQARRFFNKTKNQLKNYVDVETSSLNIQEAELAGIALSFKENEGYYIPTLDNTETILNKIKLFLENPEIKIIGHNPNMTFRY